MSAALDPKTAPALKWGILAPGRIAHKFADAVHRFTKGRVVAAGSRDLARAQEFAAQHDIARPYGRYEDLLADAEVEAVYIASPHSFHAEQAVLAAQAGKHLLVEKALAMNLGEVDAIFEAARTNKVFCMEAMWTRHLPHVIELHRLIDSHRLGRLVTVNAELSRHFPFDPESRLYARHLAGGAMLDLGVYPLAFTLDVLGAPETVAAIGHLVPQTGVEGQVLMNLGYPAPVSASVRTTLWAEGANLAVVSGEDARVEIGHNFFGPQRLQLIDNDDTVIDSFDGVVENGFQFQAAEVARCVAEGRHESERMTWQDSRDLMAVMDEARRQIGAPLSVE